ncbi:hypothetical protein Emed_006947 [Eimeria media]
MLWPIETPPPEEEHLPVESPSLSRRSADGNSFKGSSSSKSLGRPYLVVATWATFLSVLLVVFLISKCHFWISKGRATSSATRRLAGEDIEQGDSGDEFLELCKWLNIEVSDVQESPAPSTSQADQGKLGPQPEDRAQRKESRKRKKKHLESSRAKKATKKAKGGSVFSGASGSAPFRPFEGLLPPSFDPSLLFEDPGQTLEDLVAIIESGIETQKASSEWLSGDFDISLLMSPYGEAGAASSKSSSGSSERASPATLGGEDVGSEATERQEIFESAQTSVDLSSQLQPSEDLLLSEEGHLSLSPPPFESLELDFPEIPSPVQDVALSPTTTLSAQSPPLPESSSSDEAASEAFTTHAFAEAQLAGTEGSAPLSTPPTVASSMHGRGGLYQFFLPQGAQHAAAAAAFAPWSQHSRQMWQESQAPSSSAVSASSASLQFIAGAQQDVEGRFQPIPETQSQYYVSLHTPSPTTPAAARLNVLLGLKKPLGIVPQGVFEPIPSTSASDPQALAASSASSTSLSAPLVQEQQSAFSLLQEAVVESWREGEPAHPAGARDSRRWAASSGDSASSLAGPSAKESVGEAQGARESQAADAGGASTSAGPSSGEAPLSEAGLERHLYYRLPQAPWARQISAFNLWDINPGRRPSLAALLRPIRDHLVKTHINLGEAQNLYLHITLLIHFTNSYHKQPVLARRSYELVTPLACRFLIADVLYCACEVLGPSLKKEMWWDYVVGQMLGPVPYWTRDVKGGVREKLVRRLLAAAQIYRRGDRPSAKDVVTIKRALFVDLKAPTYFKSPEWDPWREDDRRDSDTE